MLEWKEIKDGSSRKLLEWTKAVRIEVKEQAKYLKKLDLERLRLFMLVSNPGISYFTDRVFLIVNPSELFDEFQRALTVDLIS